DSTFRSARFLAGKIRYQREPYCGSREEFPVATVYGDVNELELRKHSPPRRGGVDATLIKCCEASFVGADGVVSSAKCSGLRVFADLTTLLLRARLRGFPASLTAQLLLRLRPVGLALRALLCEERNYARFNSFTAP